MKRYLLFLLMLFSANLSAQIGKVIYLEGGVVIDRKLVAIGDSVYSHQLIRTYDKSLAEIQWFSGGKTVVEAGSSYSIQELSENRVKSPDFSAFKKIFKSAGESHRAEEGGIRRSKVGDTLPDPNAFYWKEEAEVSFETASALYERGDYVLAATAFKTFLNQKPFDPMAKYALFALGHCYTVLNNGIRAKEVFETFIARYADDALKSQAEVIITKL